MYLEKSKKGMLNKQTNKQIKIYIYIIIGHPNIFSVSLYADVIWNNSKDCLQIEQRNRF